MQIEEWHYLANLGGTGMSVNEELLKSVLVDIVKLAGTTTIATECGVDFDSNECEAGACEYFYDCAHQRAQYARTMSILQKITRL
jgi:hypothetical protein